ncbi:MAG: argininosuccinate lyase, partial [Chloroflexi bacterium]|nr:argininosuccinate lyase [Chloroflexota bacterium]
MKAWGGRFREAPDPLAADYTRSVELDRELALFDLVGSIAHVHGLERAGLVGPDDAARLVAGLDNLGDEVRDGTLEWDPALEDVHLNLEMALADRIGSVAGMLHAGRSRNDQVATDLRLWLRARIDLLDADLVALERALVGVAERHLDAVMPGHTHLQPAQPVLFAHHLLALLEMLERDRGRLADCRRRANRSPLGSGALAGTGFVIDREAVASELGFDGVTANSIDATGDRDFVVEFVGAAALAMVHLSRFAEELVWWSHPRFGWVRLAEPFSTGSSMLPNKRNPDPVELVRGRTARVIGDLTASLTLLKGLPLGYQRDLQEDKQPLFDAAATLGSSLQVLAAVVTTLEVNEAAMLEAAADGHITATAVAEGLVDRGVAFRAAHHIVGGLVLEAETAGIPLGRLSDEDIREALRVSGDHDAQALALHPDAPAKVRATASLDGALERCDVVGGTAPTRVRAAVAAARERLAERSRSD